jgi:hypothetical protein
MKVTFPSNEVDLKPASIRLFQFIKSVPIRPKWIWNAVGSSGGQEGDTVPIKPM